MHPRLTAAEIDRFTHVDYRDRLALIVEHGGQLIAVGRYERIAGTTEAEVAFVVDDRYQHRGIATILLEELADSAWKHGIETFVAQTLIENPRHAGCLRRVGVPGQHHDRVRHGERAVLHPER